MKNNSKYCCGARADSMLLVSNFKPDSSHAGLPTTCPTSSILPWPGLPPLCPGGLCAATSCSSFRMELEAHFPVAPRLHCEPAPHTSSGLSKHPAPSTDLHKSTITPDSLCLLVFPRDAKLLLKATGHATYSLPPGLVHNK